MTTPTKHEPLRCDHCQVRTLYLSSYPNLAGHPMERAWVCITCGCVWALTGELGEKGKRCPETQRQTGESWL